jgi:hypothetical protein
LLPVLRQGDGGEGFAGGSRKFGRGVVAGDFAAALGPQPGSLSFDQVHSMRSPVSEVLMWWIRIEEDRFPSLPVGHRNFDEEEKFVGGKY